MSNQQQNVLTEKEYQQLVQAKEPKRPVFRNCVRAFLVGGFICVLGQAYCRLLHICFNFTEKSAGNPTSATLIFISVLLTSLGVYDHIAQWAGAGTAIPVTGFANSMASAALEHRTEGYVLGVGSNMFKLAGSVIVFGVFSAFIIALIRTLAVMIGGA